MNSDTPLYQATKTRLLESLSGGVYRPGDALPAEKDLAARYGISIGTLRKAVDELVDEGILIRQQGRGTFVASHDRERLLYYFFHIVAHEGGKTYPRVELHSFTRGRASSEESAKLHLAPDAPVIRLRNLLTLGEAPVMVDDITLSSARFPKLGEAGIRGRASTLYQLYQAGFGLTIVRTSERLRAVAAPADVATLLRLPRAAPTLMIRRVALGYHDDPIEWRVSHADTTAHEYFSELGS
ncbi:MAG: GntR family transcriptional regulator [Burkholderiaceae bacterium]|nr:GntR family transcriptional regulator [Burkholderiaceae bacterium]